MIKSKDELLSQIREVIGEDNIESDQAISLIENVSDTYADFEDRAKDDWKSKYEESQRRYVERFFNTDGKEKEDEPSDPNENRPKPKLFEDLFKTE